MLFNDLHKCLLKRYFHHERRSEMTENQTWQDTRYDLRNGA